MCTQVIIVKTPIKNDQFEEVLMHAKHAYTC